MTVLVVPAREKGRGGGHLARSRHLVRELRKLGTGAFLWEPERSGDEWSVAGREAAAARKWDLVVLDRFQTPAEEFRYWSSLAPVIGIDEGGESRDNFHFLVGLLPSLPDRGRPNIMDPSLLPLPGNRRPLGKFPDRAPLRLLVSFGMEDAAGLGAMTAEALEPAKELFHISLVSGSGGGLPDFREHLAEYDLLVTHFGLTAFEALHAGLPVLLVSPGAYHEKLARASGFFSAGLGNRGAARVLKLLCGTPRRAGGKGRALSLNRRFLEELRSRCEKIARRCGLDGEPARSLAALIASWDPLVNDSCPACGARIFREGKTRPPVRLQDRTCRFCPSCGIIFIDRLYPPPVEYEKDYFFGLYKNQYGKTYLEDFPNLIAAGKRRLSRIKALLGAREDGAKPLLDIGCAYGPFLAAAGEEGFSPLGLDPAGDAVDYVRRELGIPAYRGFFPGAVFPEFRDGAFLVISLWYVIEHFREPRRVLAEIRRLLKRGGVLAFSTPSFRGISGRSSIRKFLAAAPADHFTLWGPRPARRILRQAGFRVKKIVSTGHHPERFPLIGRYAAGNRGLLYGMLLLGSRLFGLGDTFEVYAVKEETS